MLGTLTIGGTNLTTAYRVYTTDAPIYDSPIPNVDSISIPGRNGNLLIDNGTYKNISVKYPCVIPAANIGELNTADCLAGLRAFLLAKRGYVKIADTFNPLEYRTGRYVGGLEVDPTVNGDAATFTLTFDCKPQRFLVSGDTEITLTRQSGTSFGSITNPTMFHALPIVTVTGSGSGSVYIYTPNRSADYVSIPIAISDLDGTIIIDCALQDAYYGTENMNDKIVLTNKKFFELASGTNYVAVTSTFDVSSVKIVPRWWTL